MRLIDADALSEKLCKTTIFVKDGEKFQRMINDAPTVSAETVDCTDFVFWLLDEIMDEENWELNAVANGEIIARKLKKLGLLGVKDGYYVRTPSAEAVQGWIPVSDRLPNIGDTFLVTVIVGTRIRTDVASNFGSYIDGFWDTFNDWIEDEECHVTAWMPLPEPYKGGDDE